MLEAIRIFLKVVEQGSFSSAAAVLNMAPSSVARTVDGLEKELGCTLLERSTRQLKLTDKGQLFLVGAQKLVADAGQLRAALQNEPGDAKGTLRVSVFESFGRLYIAPLLGGFLQHYPGVSMDIELDNRMVDLLAEDVDLAIRIGVPADSQLKARTLLSNDMVLCAAPAYLRNYGTPQVPEDLAQHNCLLLNHGRQRTYWYFSNGHKPQKKILLQGNLKSKGGTPLLAAAEAGCGIVLLAHWMAADALAAGRLCTLLDDWQVNLNENGSGNIYAVYKASQFPNPLVRLFLDYLLDHLPSSGSAKRA
ncbi:MAG: LysR family transcriptional regulator [Saccharospirillaceae bacterium]|nr:LysR family transcriptional regulator [Saccharospirillaceae bacterium]